MCWSELHNTDLDSNSGSAFGSVIFSSHTSHEGSEPERVSGPAAAGGRWDVGEGCGWYSHKAFSPGLCGFELLI